MKTKLFFLPALFLALTLCAFLIVYSGNTAQKKQKTNATKTLYNIPQHPVIPKECFGCHSGNFPTKQNPLLTPCPRNSMISLVRTANEGPETVVMNYSGLLYGKIVFSHKIHAQMSEFSDNCGICHHYNAVGIIQKCSVCHSADRKRNDISRPDLRGSMHRQCYNCHKQWNRATTCTYCHSLKKMETEASFEQKISSLKGKSHPELKTQPQIIYETKNKDGRFVSFYHDDHVKKFNLTCKTCHRNDNCSKCHYSGNATAQSLTKRDDNSGKTHEMIHANCITCHRKTACNKCHQNEVKQTFNHKLATGYDLGRFHQNLACSKCHKKLNPPEKPSRVCTNCHKNFVLGKFNHEKTGLQLNDVHKEFECSSCHKKGFDKPPECSECHDDKRSYPKLMPGKRVK